VPLDVPEALFLTVAANELTFSETQATADPAYRQFEVQLNLTVTESRSQAQIDGLYAGLSADSNGLVWYVTGAASAFADVSDQAPANPDIPASRLGWRPGTVEGPAVTGALVTGDKVGTVIDSPPNNSGLTSQAVLLSYRGSSPTDHSNGSWDLGSTLLLKADSTVPEGAYASTLTLTLFEDTY
jgi:hypothetical protein